MAADSGYIVVYVTVPGGGLGSEIAGHLVNEGIAACVNKFKIDSLYKWKGEICNDAEELLIIKTTSAMFDRLKERVLELHTYDVPEIIALPIEAGSESYLGWIDDCVSEGSRDETGS
jgi:uncharacterized protein involved in tolerance to divalent cations